MTILSCLQCGASFNCKPSRIAIGKGKFCGRACRTAATGGHTLQYPAEYAAYLHAKERCSSSYRKAHRYAQRGIEFRFTSFEEFIAHMGPRPDGAQLDRINNDGHYEIGNVRWADARTQTNNRECTIILTYNGKTQSLSDWADETGIKYHTLWARLNQWGWSVEESLTTGRYGKYR